MIPKKEAPTYTFKDALHSLEPWFRQSLRIFMMVTHLSKFPLNKKLKSINGGTHNSSHSFQMFSNNGTGNSIILAQNLYPLRIFQHTRGKKTYPRPRTNSLWFGISKSFGGSVGGGLRYATPPLVILSPPPTQPRISVAFCCTKSVKFRHTSHKAWVFLGLRQQPVTDFFCEKKNPPKIPVKSQKRPLNIAKATEK